MTNFLNNGSVLPHGLLGESDHGMMAGFNKTYKNTSLRIGAVVNSYPTSSTRNRSKLTTEYDVLVIEQHEDKGSTTILYRNCMSSEGLGSIADFFEKALRPKKKKTSRGNATNLKGQDGAIVLVLCLDGMSDKGLIIGSLTHPDRKTKLKDEGPYLEGEYNGCNIKVNTDGSATFTFRGKTDNSGNLLDASQGPTTVKIEKDGSFQVDHKTIKLRLDKGGVVTLQSDGDVNVTTKGTANVTASKDANIKCVNATLNASGKISTNSGGETDITAGGKIVEKGSQIELNGSVSGITTENSHQGVIDLITGVPVQPSQTVKADV